MDKIDKGGSAFPVIKPETNIENVYAYSCGMSLRDYFAGQALAGKVGVGSEYHLEHNEIAVYAYKIADEMLRERKVDKDL